MAMVSVLSSVKCQVYLVVSVCLSLSCVRQGVLFALGMLLASVPPHSLLASMDGALVETGHWLRGEGILCAQTYSTISALVSGSASERFGLVHKCLGSQTTPV